MCGEREDDGSDDETNKEIVRLEQWGGAFFVSDVASAMALHRAECHTAAAVALGTVPAHPQQNGHLTLPLRVPGCAARALLAAHHARLVGPVLVPRGDAAADALYAALHARGYWVTDGLKYGAQWMCYRGDPLVYHASCAVVAVGAAAAAGAACVSTAAELVAFARLCNTTRKTAVLAAAGASEVPTGEENAPATNAVVFHTLAWVPDM